MNLYAQVLIAPLDQELTYEIPDELVNNTSIGQKVEITLGRRHSTGFIVSLSETTELDKAITIKPINRLIGDCVCFNEEQLHFFRWIASYYNQKISNVIDTAIPQLALPRYNQNIILNSDYSKESIRGHLQKEIIAELNQNQGHCSYDQLAKKYKGAPACLKSLKEKGVISIEKTERAEHSVDSELIPSWTKSEVYLNSEQELCRQQVVSAAQQGRFEAVLLHGITGSGKTEVYIEAIHELLLAGKGSLILVPEIALTPQLIDRFRARLGNQIAILHSGLSRRERWNYWRALIRKDIIIAIGARSAIFAPIPNLGLIVVDEEHDSSYKQAEGLRYNARDLAIVRSKLNQCPVILGSATPSLESFGNAAIKKFSYLPLKHRHSATQRLQIECIDLNQTRPSAMASRNISKSMHKALKQVLEQKQQAFILYNRRGFASYLQCTTCEESISCPNCSVTLTLHRSRHKLLCHYCNYQIMPPTVCPKCSPTGRPLSTNRPQTTQENQAGELIQRGGGTEKVFEEVSELFPEARIARLDRDSTNNHHDYKRILSQLRAGEFDFLVGTQMIAKGHDLPGVTLVGVIDCDIGLHFPDFRGAERVFQLLTQAAGRAGRAEQPGQVILQTRASHHHSIIHTIKQNYIGFAKEELALRKETGYPPFSRLLRVVASSNEPTLATNSLQKLADLARNKIKNSNWPISVLGPAPAPIERIKGKYRWHLLLKSRNVKELLLVRNLMQKGIKKNSKIQIVFDLDPQDML